MPRSLACAAGSIELSGTFKSFAKRCNAAVRSPGRLTSCSATPGGGVRVHRGMTVNPLILHLPRGVAPPARAWRDLSALHQEGVRGQYRAVTDGHVVVDEGTDSDSAAIADRGSTGLEGAVLLRLALDH